MGGPAAPVLPAAPAVNYAARRKMALAAVVGIVVVGGAAAVMLGAFTGAGQCVLQEVDFQGTVHYTRGENYSESECNAYCAAHLPPNGGARGCWFDEY